jgi:hypothetical protein
LNKLFYKIYHGNLAFSAIEEESLPEVIDKTYFPLLELIEKNNFKVGLELSAFSLEKILELRPIWIEKFKELHKKGLIELIGSGYMQIIGPLVPYEINIRNQKIGLQVYKKILDITPSIAYVNEQVFSSSMVDVYNEAGYKAIAMEWNNAYSINSKNGWKKEFAFQPVMVKGLHVSLPILWTDTIVFQQFQRMAHQEIKLSEYLEIIAHHIDSGYKALPIYSSDLEIFNYRPGRFETEALISTDEWDTIAIAMNELKKYGTFCLPSEVLQTTLAKTIELVLPTADTPILVKKQGKYSLSRWSACGKGANLINTLCYNFFLHLKDDFNTIKLLQYWGSDYRTHTTIDKWNKAMHFLNSSQDKKENINSYQYKDNDVVLQEVGHKLIFEKDAYKIIFNKSKGLVLFKVYREDQELPFGTIKHGDLDYITHGADFYTGTSTIESANTKKNTDLSDVGVYDFVRLDENKYLLSTVIHMKNEIVEHKKWIIDLQEKKLTLDIRLQVKEFINGSIRLGTFTLLPQTKESKFWYECKNGGNEYERFYLKNTVEVEHHQAKSILQSSLGGLGVTDGILRFGVDTKTICELEVDRTVSYPFVMLQNSCDQEKYLTRVFFGIQELDDTLKISDRREFKLKYSIRI